MKKYLLSILVITTLLLTACASTVTTPEDWTDDDLNSYENNNIMHEEEMEDAELKFKDTEQEKFYGTWVANSGQAEYLYGNVEITIKENSLWDGIITDEDLTGTWKYKNGSMYLYNELIDLKLSFTENNTLIMQEVREEGDEPINTVLVKKTSL